MNKKAVEEYYHKDFLPILSEAYGIIKAEMKREESKIKERWMKEIQQAFETIRKRQKEKRMETISFINFTFLRTRYMQKNYNYAIYAYGKDWYFGKEYAVGNLDVSFFFKHFETAIIKLQKEALKYFGKVQAIDVERLLLEETGRNVFFMQSLFRKWMKEICQMDSFQQVEKNLYFRMELGEYYEPGLFLYIENKDRNDQKEKRKLRKDNNHCGKDLENLNVDNLSFVGKDFVDTNFQKASMRSSKWDNCAMQGANFSGATLSNAQFYQCILQESIWKHGDFRNVLFEECMMYSGEKQVLKNFCPDYQKIDLEQCCLCGAKFIRCVMSGMDFSKADITDCTFEDCILTGCTFTEEQILWHQLDREKWKLQAK